MKIRARTLWRLPAYCVIASWVSYYVVLYSGAFFTTKTVRPDGVTEVSIDLFRSNLLQGGLFLLILLLGGLLVCRSLTRAETALSAALLSAGYLAVALAQIYAPDFPMSLRVGFAPVQNWTGMLVSFLLRLVGHITAAILLSCLAPFLFVPFGRRQAP